MLHMNHLHVHVPVHVPWHAWICFICMCKCKCSCQRELHCSFVSVSCSITVVDLSRWCLLLGLATRDYSHCNTFLDQSEFEHTRLHGTQNVQNTSYHSNSDGLFGYIVHSCWKSTIRYMYIARHQFPIYHEYAWWACLPTGSCATISSVVPGHWQKSIIVMLS